MSDSGQLILAFATAAAVFLPAPAGAADGWTLDQLMSRMAEVHSARAAFTETRSMATLSKPFVLTGTLTYERPAKLERHVLTPYEERFAVQGDTLVIENKRSGHSKTLLLSSQPVLQAFVESMRATLAGDQKTLSRYYRPRLEGPRSDWTLLLEPTGADMAKYVRLIRVSGSGNRISAIDVEETGGDRSHTRINSEGS